MVSLGSGVDIIGHDSIFFFFFSFLLILFLLRRGCLISTEITIMVSTAGDEQGN